MKGSMSETNNATEAENTEESPLNSARAKYYDELWAESETVKVTVDGSETDAYLTVPWKSNGEFDNLPVKEIPINAGEENGLWYNVENTRILAYRLSLEKKENRKISSAVKEDREFIEDKLLNNDWYYAQATEDLKNELKDVGQREPAIISADGIIWNANRRIAVRQQLFTETGNEKWNRVQAVKLPKMSRSELKELEHRLQMQKEFKADYGSVNLRLRCRQALAAPEDGGDEWTMQKLLNSFNGKYKKSQVEKFIQEIGLVDEFLEFTGNPSDYARIQTIGKGRGMEIFSALNDQITWERDNPQTEHGESLDKLIEDVKYIGFILIHNPKSTYKDLRDFRDILRRKETRNALLKNSIVVKDPASTLPPSTGTTAPALSTDNVVNEKKNLENEQNVYDALKNTPAEVLEDCLKRLQTIDVGRINPSDGDLKRSVIASIDKIKDIVQKPDFSEDEKKELIGIIEKINEKIS